MRALVVLTPAESKRLISKALLAMDEVKKARASGIITIHPSSSTYFLIEELTGAKPTGIWVCGVIVPRGMCSARTDKNRDHGGGVRHNWIVQNGVAERGRTIVDILASMGPDDIYVRGCNALDPEGNVGVIVGERDGGPISLAIGAAKRQGFKIVAPVSLGKHIPVPIREAARHVGINRIDKAMGKPVSLIRVPATVVTEVDAVRILTGATATPVAAGGLGGAEGALSLALTGTEEQVLQAYSLVESVKGAQLPVPTVMDCRDCPNELCHFRGRGDGGWLPGMAGPQA